MQAAVRPIYLWRLLLSSSSSINASSSSSSRLTQHLSKMKLLGWMHRKLRSNNDVFKEFSSGGGGSCNCITGLASPDPATFLASANEYFADDTFATNHPSPPATDLFTFGGSGLLTIGTLGIAAVAVPEDDDDDYYCNVDAELDNSDGTDNVEDVDDGAVTPTFTYPTAPEDPAVEKAVAAVEAIAEKDDNATTEDDLMVVSSELEKVLGSRNSGAAGDLVASARVSFAMGVDCPLQGFLFGSPVSDVESRPEQPRDSVGGRRTSLGELFMRTRFADEKVALVAVEEGEDGATGGEREEGRAGKGGGGHKMLKKWKVKDEKVAGCDGAPASATVTKSKFQKILQIFHRKVHPESTALARRLTKKSRKRNSSADEPEPPASPKLRCRKEQRMPGFGCCANRATFGGAASPDDDDGELNSSKIGHWIRTDAEYLVLEL
ncbi:protein LAZY 1-like [Phragmites australis]|uniref:protein LAZY 1-like n=1 Tax=Phragmites australis TaxID=29695 RepID=UPI002D792E2D|nr:protein LAZY 1-like [Phragmites australis]